MKKSVVIALFLYSYVQLGVSTSLFAKGNLNVIQDDASEREPSGQTRHKKRMRDSQVAALELSISEQQAVVRDLLGRIEILERQINDVEHSGYKKLEESINQKFKFYEQALVDLEEKIKALQEENKKLLKNQLLSKKTKKISAALKKRSKKKSKKRNKKRPKKRSKKKSKKRNKK